MTTRGGLEIDKPLDAVLEKFRSSDKFEEMHTDDKGGVFFRPTGLSYGCFFVWFDDVDEITIAWVYNTVEYMPVAHYIWDFLCEETDWPLQLLDEGTFEETIASRNWTKERDC